MRKVSEVIDAVLALIERPHGWIRGVLSARRIGVQGVEVEGELIGENSAFCLIGGMDSLHSKGVIGAQLRESSIKLLGRVIWEERKKGDFSVLQKPPKITLITSYNDYHPKEAVVEVLKKAYKVAKDEEAATVEEMAPVAVEEVAQC